MSEFYQDEMQQDEMQQDEMQQDEMRQIECEILRDETNKQLDQLAEIFDASSKEEKSAILLDMILQFMKKMQSKPDRMTEFKRQNLLDEGWIDSDISILEKEIEKRQ
jgi:hypothetical protein